MNPDKVFQEQDEMNVIFVHSSLDDMGLSPFAFRAYCHLARRANKSSEAWPGMLSMGRVCGFSESTAKRAIRELEERSMLVVQRSSGGLATNRYILTSPSKWTSSDTGFTQNPVPTEPGPGSHRPAKVIQEGNPEEYSSPISDGSDSSPIITPMIVKELWNTCCPDLPPVREVTGARFRAARIRCRDNAETLRQCFTRINKSDFVTGRSGSPNKWATFDWVMKADNFNKVMEGRYDNRSSLDNRSQAGDLLQ